MDGKTLTWDEALKRIPLAEAAYRMLGEVFSEPLLDQVWQSNRGRGYCRKITFDTVVELVSSALLRHHGSGRASFDEAHEQERLPASCTAAYGKLGRTPVKVGAALLQEGADLLRRSAPPGVYAQPLPACLDDFQVLAVDGKVVKRVPHLAKLVRNAKAAVLGGKASVLIDVRTRLVLSLAASGDGYADELALTRQLLERKDRLGDGRPTLLVLDRLYSNREIPTLCLSNHGHFLIRFGGKLQFREDPDCPPRQSRDAQGALITQRWGWINVRHGQPLRVRHITREPVHGKVIQVITDLLSDESHPAADLLDVYRCRWSIECIFHLVVKTFGLDELIVTTPRGTVFQFAFCLILHNVVQMIKLFLSEHTTHPVERISSEKLLTDVQDQLQGLHAFYDTDVIIDEFKVQTVPLASRLRQTLRRILEGVWRPRWMKAPPQNRGKPTAKTKVRGNQVSAYRVIEQHKAKSQRC